MKKISLIFILISLIFFEKGISQKIDNKAIKNLVASYKKDVRGPYKDLRWFCPDGSTVPASERCLEPGGLQRARYKDDVVLLGEKNHIYLGQILATTPFEDFWDSEFNHSRLKQYQLEKYLKLSDNGWVLQRGQYYRGAIQAEDEEDWGIRFFSWLLADEKAINNQFYFIRQAARDIPHQGDDNRTQNIRAVSKRISDQDPAFMNIRIKIHGQPEKDDLQMVEEFKKQNKDRLSPIILAQIDTLVADMTILYQPVNLNDLNKYIKALPGDTKIRKNINNYINQYAGIESGPDFMKATCELLFAIRVEFHNVKKPSGRLSLLDISIALEDIIFREISNWETITLDQLMEKTHYLSKAATGAGYIEMWEWEKVSEYINLSTKNEIYFYELSDFFENARRITEWSSGMVRSNYQDVIYLYGDFEPLSNGFTDNRIRSSLLLPYGRSVGLLGDFIAEKANISNQITGVSNQNNIRGLNPGYALGELAVYEETGEAISIESDKIYIFNHPPSDMKPVAGIATVSEGNMVSHVQLLARNLGIPNAVISLENLNELKTMAGKKVFYAVSNKGSVILKEAENMTPEEKKLFSIKSRNEERINVPIDKIILKETIINLKDISSKDSGKLCGPKAANLGQLKQMFPNHVVEGIVIPFGIFRAHMDQLMPEKNISYWQYLNNAFSAANEMRNSGKKESEIEVFMLEKLSILKTEITRMPLKAEFLKSLKDNFSEAFGKKMGQIPVFLRSDTNMEDLKDFTGAGLNLTLFNVIEEDKIIQGIKEVWASPYTERSYKWRQKYLLNPENVFPSILIIPSVDVDYSGVMITKGVQSGNKKDVTVAFSRGAGGAVEGQAAETYLLAENGVNILVAPSREMYYNSLPVTGGTKRNTTFFKKPILNDNNLKELRDFASELKEQMMAIEISGPYDVELGFKSDKLWLFQVRPFVENKRAASSEYLESISPKIPVDKVISLDTKIINP